MPIQAELTRSYQASVPDSARWLAFSDDVIRTTKQKAIRPSKKKASETYRVERESE